MLKEKTIVQFSEALASSEPVPGGGALLRRFALLWRVRLRQWWQG